MLEATFEIVTGHSVWGHIEGDIMEQQDLQDELNSISGGLADSITAVDNKYDSITGALDDKIDSINGALSDSISAVDDKYNSITGGLSDSITALDSVVSINFTTLSDSITALDSVVSSNFTTLSDSIVALDSIVSSNFTTLSDSIVALDSVVSDNYNTLDSLIGGVDDKIDVHIADKANPHEVTASQVGLGSCDNTSDADKPVSTAQQTALDGKVDKLVSKPTAGTYTKVTITSEGLVSSGDTLSASDIPSLTLAKISDVTASASEVNILDGATLTTTELNYVDGVTSNIQTQFGNITDLIPSQATITNQLADKDFVNSSIATNTAKFIGTFATVTALNAYAGTVTNNDYAFVVNSVVTDNGNDWATFNDLDAYNKDLLTNFDYAWVINSTKFDLYRFDILNQTWELRVSNTDKADVTLNTAYNRYKATVTNNTTTWEWEYTLNNSSFTAAQWLAINSGITSATKVTHTANTAVGNSTTPVYIDASGNATALSCTLATSVPVGAVFTDTTYTFSTGSANGTIAVSVNGGAASDVLVKGLGTAAYTSSGDYATAAQGTKADSAIQSVKVNGSALTPDANKAVDVTVPTKISDLSDDTATYPIDKADTLTGLTATIAELNYVDGVTSGIQTQLNGKLTTSDIVSSVSSSSTNSKAVGAKLFYDTCGDIETLINAL